MKNVQTTRNDGSKKQFSIKDTEKNLLSGIKKNVKYKKRKSCVILKMGYNNIPNTVVNSFSVFFIFYAKNEERKGRLDLSSSRLCYWTIERRKNEEKLGIEA
ncbi:hypothetical protein ACKWTF_008248 [Chironomus riparius]